MTPAQVWAPAAKQVEMDLGAERIAMLPLANGWWEAPRELAPGEDYTFRLDGGPPLPDPRSRWQPHGVHGPSRWMNHAAFPWTDAEWQPPAWERAVLYEAHIGTFTPEGTFDAAIGRLEYLRELGVTHFEIMPVAEFAGERGWGYDGVDLFAPHHTYGGPAGLQRLVNACHKLGLAVILDVVYNHLGPVGNYLARYGPYFTDRYHTPWGAAVNLDGPESDEVRAFFLDNARQWLRDYHCDGLRLDAVHALLDRSATSFLEDLARERRELQDHLGRPLLLIAESDDNDPRLSATPETGGVGLTAQWNEDFHHAVHAALTGERHGYFADFAEAGALRAVFERGQWLDGRYSRFRRRRHGRKPRALTGKRFVIYVQNHDQVGNRARGERLTHLLPLPERRLAAALLLFAPYIPLLFQGEEWGATAPFLYFTDFAEPELARAVREGRQRESQSMGWPGETSDPQNEAAFDRSRLAWTEVSEPEHASLFEWYKALIRLRRRIYPGDPPGHAQFDCAADLSWLRVDAAGWTLAANRGDKARVIGLAGGREVTWQIELAVGVAELVPKGVRLASGGIAVLSRLA